ncbi:MAG: sensor histidine kinase [Achromobacter mucicolens]|jgi:PAS domain S-box-containing protein|uniref:PAS domain-containing sensor histidine kinase n=1 Tax=Achromobacter TaxID=222 RepID=UPI0014684666|nr:MULTISPECIES: PAS domain-containing sensor histidine kinase [Achromobacter]MCU6616958.1 PAS domain-containing sensor histidine kinase [Achromobacter mucicolens]MDF2861803.1 sensor histidine kinase [Achromobacter mucicolens]MDH1522326.1 PAS domain-containing sensor histidine kinase [Achromobacter mucicolens]UDG78238.1 PAS domain-containing sensor histidine kinase [Achromobacter sp. 77]CAB3831357.1 Oxygen sensor histidine kinase NreB [Achromobacter mucicolens]
MKLSSGAPPLLDIIQSATEPIITIDALQHIVMFNAAAERVFMLSADQAIGASVDILIPLRFRAVHAKHVGRFMTTGISDRQMGLGAPLWGLRSNGEEFPMEASISQTCTSAGVYLSIFLRDITERQRIDQALRASRDELTRLSNALLHVREQEKKHIARELHDDLGQSLTALTMELSQLEPILASDNVEARERVRSMRQLIKATFKSLRRIASDLRPVMLDDLGLAAAVEWLVANFVSRYGVDTESDIRIGPAEPAKQVATTLFRVVQEALTNIAKHAQASAVQVRLVCDDSHCALTVSDNGVGATPESLAKKLPLSLGLQGIRERVRLLGGDVSVHTRRKGGFRLEVRIPVRPPDSQWEAT